jgi:ATP phosphoribosyltransferase
LGHYKAAVDLIVDRVNSGTTLSEDEKSELRKTAAKALVAMIEIWMSDLW